MGMLIKRNESLWEQEWDAATSDTEVFLIARFIDLHKIVLLAPQSTFPVYEGDFDWRGLQGILLWLLHSKFVIYFFCILLRPTQTAPLEISLMPYTVTSLSHPSFFFLNLIYFFIFRMMLVVIGFNQTSLWLHIVCAELSRHSTRVWINHFKPLPTSTWFSCQTCI